MTELFSDFFSEIKRSKSILLTTHERTDGDDFGAVLALAHVVSQMGKHYKIIIKGGVPRALRFLKGSNEVMDQLSDEQFDLAIVSGCSSRDRVGIPDIFQRTTKVVNLDHHPDNQYFGDINLVFPAMSSVCELVAQMLKSVHVHVTPEIATSLLTGIVADTGFLVHSNTTKSVYMTCAELLIAGAALSSIVKHTRFGRTWKDIREWGEAFEETFFDQKTNGVITVTKHMSRDVLVGFSQLLSEIAEGKYSLLVTDEGGVIKGSLRGSPKKGLDVKKIAELFGGGGHTWASGFSFEGRLSRSESGLWEVTQPTTIEA